MAPKTKYTKKEIIESAFEIAEKKGMDALTIRRIAKQLGSSIAPIYVNFNNVKELKEAVVHKTLDIVKEMITEQNSGHRFRDIGIGSVKFAREYSVLYRDLIMKNNEHMKHNEENMRFVIEQMKTDPMLAQWTDASLQNVLFKMEIFQTGLCVMAANDLLPETHDEEKMIDLLDMAAEDFLHAVNQAQHNSEDA